MESLNFFSCKLMLLLLINRKLFVCRSCRGRQLLLQLLRCRKLFACRLCCKLKLLLLISRKFSACRLWGGRQLLLQLLRCRKLFACRSCRGRQLLLPITAKVTKNALERVGKTSRRICSARHNHLAQNDAELASAQTTAPFCRAARDLSAYAANFVNTSR
jgi:hypothetical protein